MEFSSDTDDNTGNDPAQALDSRLAAHVDEDAQSLTERLAELASIKRDVRKLDSVDDIHRITVQANYEIAEVKDAIQHIAELEGQAFEPPSPSFKMEAVEQASLGGDGGWLDDAHREQVVEAGNTDFTKLMDEGPEVFVASLEDETVGESGVVKEMAAQHIRSKTAGTPEDATREAYERVFVARVEECRQARLLERQARFAEEFKKEAAAEEELGPDEGLFL
jgi:hypothetical protein